MLESEDLEMSKWQNKIVLENKQRKVLYHIWFSKEVRISRMKKKGRTNLFDKERRNRNRYIWDWKTGKQEHKRKRNGIAVLQFW